MYRIILALILALGTGCTSAHKASGRSKAVTNAVEQASVRGKDRILIFVVSELVHDLFDDEEVYETIWANYYFEEMHLSHGFDMQLLRSYFASQKRSRRFRSSLTFEEYLLIRDQAFSRSDVELIKHLKVSQTPELIVLDTDGNVLDRYKKMTSDLMFTEMVRSGVFARDSDLTPEQLDAIIWGLDQEQDRESLLSFLRRNAM